MSSGAGRQGMVRADQIPNAITILRMLAVAPLLWLLWQRQYALALMLAFAAGASDAVDGFLAKRYGWTSRLGGLLDPLADKLLLVSCFLVLTVQGHLPGWLLALVIGRDLLIIGGGTAFHFLVRPVEGEPSMLSKANTCLQIGLILWVLLDLAWLELPMALGGGLVVAVAATTVGSGLHYVWEWGRRAWLALSRGRG